MTQEEVMQRQETIQATLSASQPCITLVSGEKRPIAEIAKRIQSPSSIGIYKHCPRKYFYQYIKKLPMKENIHLVRGKIVHSVLERFFDMNPEILNKDNYVEELTYYLKNLFHAFWSKEKNNIMKLGLTEDQIVFYYEESILMLANWLNHILEKIRAELDYHTDFVQVFQRIKPAVIEQEFKSSIYAVRGFVDYIEVVGDVVKIMDYKTSKKKELSQEYMLQLAIYALLYEETYGRRANKVGLWLLKHGEMTMNVDQELIDLAKFEIEQIHVNTQTSHIHDYQRHEGPLCKWSTGQCDFYDVCMKDKRAGM